MFGFCYYKYCPMVLTFLIDELNVYETTRMVWFPNLVVSLRCMLTRNSLLFLRIYTFNSTFSSTKHFKALCLLNHDYEEVLLIRKGKN